MAAASRTASMCAPEKEQGTHAFDVLGYSLHRGMGVGKCITSGVFSVGGFDWAILFYPDGKNDSSKDYISVHLELQSWKRRRIFGTIASGSNAWIEVPQSDLAAHLGKLLEAEKGADVTFGVGGDTFAAHKVILAMRSPVFKATLYGPMSETGTQVIPIADMQPAVFKSLLHFIYTDSLPAMGDLEGNDHSEMIRHLLVAADRYAMDRLKLICQSMLCEDLGVQNVATTLALADQHHCDMLKDACIEFISSSTVDDIVATQGFLDLKKNCPSVLVDAFVKINNIRKI
ncbi:hypothetical protein ACP70R_003118 [Stipagrostis hirtigluma subsp. patula]